MIARYRLLGLAGWAAAALTARADQTVGAGHTLALDATGGTCPIVGTLTVNAGGKVDVTGDGTGLGFNPGASVTTLNLHGGTVMSEATMHIWQMTGGVTMTGGLLASNGGRSDPNGAFLEWNSTAVQVQPDANPAEIAGRIRMRYDNDFWNLVFEVADGDAKDDLRVSAAITEVSPGMGIGKTGPGVMVCSGRNAYSGETRILDGTLVLRGDSDLCDTAAVQIGTADRKALLVLEHDRADAVGALSIGGRQVAGGTWGAPGSVAAGRADLESPYLGGSGVLKVTDGRAYAPLQTTERRPGSRAFHVDAQSGADTNDGLSPATAWRSLDRVNAQVFEPGDSLLFRAGGEWSGQLRPKGSGTPGDPIRLDSYGDGPLPRIDQGALAGNVLELENQDQWEIAHLELSGGTGKTDTQVGGIHVKATTAGRVLRHIVIRDCVIRNLRGTVRQYESCAIWVGVPGWNHENGLTTGFDGVRIENNRIRNADRCGILVWTTAGPGPATQFQAGLIPAKNVAIRGNDLRDIGGDAILVLGSDKPLVERNVVRRSSIRCGMVSSQQGGYNASSAAIWLHHCLEGVLQYNAVYDSAKLWNNNDGMAYDFDFNCHRCVLQYNYSRGNAGGFLLIMPTATQSVVRYNVSENDRDHVLFLVGNLNEENLIHNNTFYIEKDAAYIIPRARIRNNLFMAAGTASWEEREPGGGEFLANGYAGNWRQLPNDAAKVVADPLLADPGAGGPNAENLGAYRPRPGSPCIGRGVPVQGHAGRDILDRPVPTDSPPDIGACQH